MKFLVIFCFGFVICINAFGASICTLKYSRNEQAWPFPGVDFGLKTTVSECVSLAEQEFVRFREKAGTEIVPNQVIVTYIDDEITAVTKISANSTK